MRWFFGTFLFGVAALVVAQLLPLRGYDAAPIAACYSMSCRQEAKLYYMLDLPRFDVLLMGNSRIEPARPAQVADGFTGFNGSLPGTNLRTAIAVLETLVENGRGPEIAIISVDNVALSQTGLPSHWPRGVAGRLRILAEDVVALAQARPPVSDITSFLHSRILITEAEALLQWGSPQFAWERFSTWLVGLGAEGDRRLPRDGSSSPSGPSTADLDGHPPPLLIIDDVTAPLLEHDLDRLDRIQVGGTRVILYESPLLPEVAARAEATMPPRPARIRERLFTGCLRRRIECHAAPVIVGSAENGFWNDYHHPPQRGLEQWLKGILRPHLAARRAEREAGGS